MLGRIFEYLRDGINDYLKLLHQQLLEANLASRDLFQEQDAILLFDAHATILEQLLADGYCPHLGTFREQFKAEIDRFIDVQRRCQSNGLDIMSVSRK